MLNKTYRKGTSQEWDRNSNQNIAFTEEALNNENKNSDKTHHKKKKAIVIGNSMMVNNINERGLSKSNKVLVKKFPGTTSEKILEEMNEIIKEKPDSIIIHAETNDLSKNINLLNSAKKKKKIVKDRFLEHCSAERQTKDQGIEDRRKIKESRTDETSMKDRRKINESRTDETSMKDRRNIKESRTDKTSMKDRRNIKESRISMPNFVILASKRILVSLIMEILMKVI